MWIYIYIYIENQYEFIKVCTAPAHLALPRASYQLLMIRFNGTSLHQRDARTQLFDGFDSSSSSRPNSPGFRTATPNARGQYSDSVMSGLESQNENELEGLTARVRLLKDVCVFCFVGVCVCVC